MSFKAVREILLYCVVCLAASALCAQCSAYAAASEETGGNTNSDAVSASTSGGTTDAAAESKTPAAGAAATTGATATTDATAQKERESSSAQPPHKVAEPEVMPHRTRAHAARSSASASGNHAAQDSSAMEPGWTIDIAEHNCKISCVDPHPACSESAKLIDLLRVIYEAYVRSDFATVSRYMADNCTTFDEGSKQLVQGKKAVLKDLEAKVQQYRTSESPLIEYKIERPYAHVSNDTGTITFVAYKIFGGKHPQKFESRCTDIFVKENGQWKKLHYRSNWKPIS
ncbi:MAG TPA: nuclear transport factor 2 family protein [Chroococcales cyanobacterium]